MTEHTKKKILFIESKTSEQNCTLDHRQSLVQKHRGNDRQNEKVSHELPFEVIFQNLIHFYNVNLL